MDMVGKAMFSQQVNKLKDDFGLKDEEEDSQKGANYDPGKWAEEDAKMEEERSKRKEGHAKRQAERAATREKMREKYGLKESKHDQKLLTHGAADPTSPSQEASSSITRSPSSQSSQSSQSSSSDKKEDKCSVM